MAKAEYSTIPGGESNLAVGRHSFAAGHQANANHDGSFVWADSTNADFYSERNDQFRLRANGGARFDVNNSGWVDTRDDGVSLITTSTGARLSLGGVWENSSDRAVKENFAPVDGCAVLEKLASLPISTWNYKAEHPKVRHLGPVAQDFHAAFGLGQDDRHIAGLDTSGVALAALQGLYEIAKEKDARIAAQAEEISALHARLERIEARLADLARAGSEGAR